MGRCGGGGRWYRLPIRTRCKEMAAAVATAVATGEREGSLAAGRGDSRANYEGGSGAELLLSPIFTGVGPNALRGNGGRQRYQWVAPRRRLGGMLALALLGVRGDTRVLPPPCSYTRACSNVPPPPGLPEALKPDIPHYVLQPSNKLTRRLWGRR